MKRELPPTAGLAPRWRDLIEHPDKGAADMDPRQLWRMLRDRMASVEPQSHPNDTDAAARQAPPPAPHPSSKALADCLAALIGTEDPVLVNSGYAALVIAFEYLKKGALGREVILPAFTSPKVALAAHRAGLRVRLCDTGQSRFDFDLGMLARLVSERTLAVVPTHFGGHVTPLRHLQVLLQGIAPHVVVIEDAAQSFGAQVNGDSVGLKGDLGLFSFARGLGPTLFQGGCLVSSNPMIRQSLKTMAAQMQPRLWRPELRQCLGLLAYHAFYDAEHYRLVYGASSHRKGTSLPRYAIFGEDNDGLSLHGLGAWRQRVVINALQRWPDHQRQVAGRAKRLVEALGSVPRSDLHLPPEGTNPANHFLFVSMASRKQADRVLADSIEEGLGISRLYAGPLTAYPALRDIIGDQSAPQAEALAARTLTVTTSPLMSDSDIEKIARLFRQAGRTV